METPNVAQAPARLSGMLIGTLLAGCMISLLSFGVRGAYGLFTAPLTTELGITREVYAIAIAIQNLCWGIAQPLAGVVADRWGARRVLLAGAIAYGLGIVGLVFASTPMQLYLTAGVLTGLGMGGASFITVVAALGRAMPQSHRSWAMGLGTAGGSLGQFVIVPITQAVIGAGGWRNGAWVMAAAVAVIVLAAFLVRGDRPTPRPANEVRITGGQILGAAFSYPSYLLLVAGFFVCGFQLGFITTHFPAYLQDKGLGAGLASWGIAMVGLFNVVGAYFAGVWGGKRSKKGLLASIYFARAVIILLFLTMPLSTASVLLFGASMGLMWLSTVPLTSGLVATFFGTRYMATLFGIVFFSHQVGSFMGVYMGGYLYERTGSYDVVWWWCIGLSVFAGLVNLPIREKVSQPFSKLVPA
ncbi:MFS transporter [Ramlibacter sp.]|uniref:MFS transporter n=1 Tax=Ramlibacter sp. TaxID=1917967 RepID=UPI0018365110|nr:MFS transporter [Ramlibacter sp.]MBA2672449.1 MFS transporter [Ramlibacter sp.]